MLARNTSSTSRSSFLHRRAPWLGLAFLSLVLGAGGAASCGGGGDSNQPTGGGASGGAGGSGGSSGSFVTSSGSMMAQSINIAPQNPTIQVVYGTPGVTMQFTATDMAGQAISPAWSLNTPEAGTIDQNGLFTSNGMAGGEVVVSARLGQETAFTTLTINLTIVENTIGLPQADQDILTGPGGTPDAGWQVLYPYNATVFPRGILPPEHHFAGGMPASAYSLRISMPGCDYLGFFPPNPQIAPSQATWDALGSCSTGGDATVEIAELVNGQKYGPITRTMRIAKGKLHGTIYYNTYDSSLAGGTGAMMRIQGNSAAPEVLLGGCTVCHSVGADGSTAVAANHSGPGGTFDLSGGNVNPPLVWTDAERAAFAAVYPTQGEVLVINGAPGGSWPPNTPGTSGTWTSELRSRTGAIIPSSGIEGYYAQTPVFSHDGTMLAFTDRPAGGGASALALLNYDAMTQKFNNYQVLGTPAGGYHYSWPAFTPDSKFVVFQDGMGDDLATWSSNTGRLRMVDVATRTIADLTMLNGDGYMPGGARDENLNYEPTILPIASGGYFWVMFTSRRTYGNRLTGTRYETKRLWVAAIDINAQPGADASHPAFYIAGQEITSGNSRGFWALDPCRQDGASCETGDQCCNGSCNPSPDGSGGFTCGVNTNDCSAEFGSCVTSADCCAVPPMECINGHCAQVVPE